MLELQAERGGDGRTGVVVGGRTDATGGNDEIIGAPSFAHLTGNFLGIITHHDRTGDG